MTHAEFKSKFLFLKSKRCNVAIPKLACDKIFVDRKKKGKWEVVYNTISVHQTCPESNGLFYCYKTTSTEYDGYFVRGCNGKWREYRPNMKRELWAEFEQDSEDENYFVLLSKHNTVYVPKSMDNRFIIKKNDNSSWRGGYTTSAIYDRSAGYDYNFSYVDTYTTKRNNGLKQLPGSVRVSFDRIGNVQVAYDEKFHDFKYRSMKLERYENVYAIHITIDDKNSIWVISQDSCVVDCEVFGKKMVLVGCSNEEGYREINSVLSINPIVLLGK